MSKEYSLMFLHFSLHAGSENESEQLKELHALMKEDLTPAERVYVRRSIEQHKLGTNRTLLKQVRWNCVSPFLICMFCSDLLSGGMDDL